MESIENAYSALLWISAALLSVFICVCLVRVILGPRFTDRIVSINIICTQTIIMIALLSCLFHDGNLLDVAIVYAMIAFLAVVVLSKCYIMPFHTNPLDLSYDKKNEEDETK